MMPSHHLLGAGLALLLSLAAATEAAAVTIAGAVQTPGTYALGNNDRLLDAILHAQPSPDTYWLGAHYARRANVAPQARLKEGLLARLRDYLTADHDQEAVACLGKFEQELAKLPITGRQSQALDPEALDLDARANRRLQDGDSLVVPLRPPYIVIQGLVREELKLPYRHGRLAADYLAEAQRCAGANRSHVWIIYPDGTTRRIGIAYWNEEPVNLAPGARLLVPLAEGRWDDATPILNARMAEFLATQPLP